MKMYCSDQQQEVRRAIVDKLHLQSDAIYLL